MAKTIKKTRVFLSHSSYDKDIVRRVRRDLVSHGVDAWIDEEGISTGGSIVGSLQKALDAADFLLLFLTPRAVESRWVEVEWASKLFDGINKERINIIPLLIEECEIPLFLRDRKYIDFRVDYETGLSALLSMVQGSPTAIKRADTVFEYTVDRLEDLANESFSLPLNGRIRIIDTLKALPRSGKKVRLEGFRQKVGIRSIYDHILSLAHSADCLMPVINHGLTEQEANDLALCIAYHDLNECILGDIPVYTNLSQNKRRSARVFAEERLRTVSPQQRNSITNQFLAMFLNDNQREALKYVDNLLDDGNSKLYKFFRPWTHNVAGVA